MVRQILVLATLLCTSVLSFAQQHPNVRAITAFVRIDRDHYQQQIGDALKMLRPAKAAYEKAGFTVQSVRVTTQPFPEYTRGLSRADAVKFLLEVDAFAKKEDFLLNIGPAVVKAGDDLANFDVLGDVLNKAMVINASAIVADDSGVHWDAVRAAGHMVKYVSENSPRSGGNFGFAATAMIAPYTPFYPGSYHLGPGKKFAVAMQGANVVIEAFKQSGYDPAKAESLLTKMLSEHLVAAEAVALKIAKESGWEYMGIDPTPAPLKDVSIGVAIENFTGKRFGSSATMTAAAIITRAQRAVPIKIVGYAGLMLPVLEDTRLAERWTEGSYNVDSLLAYSAVCATGLDTVPLPGDITEEQLARMIGDMATLAYKWKKPLTARLMPVAGRKAGEQTPFDDPYLENVTLHPVP